MPVEHSAVADAIGLGKTTSPLGGLAVTEEPEPNAAAAELDWLAFRYVAGEATPDEARALEERMTGDQTAREAVARAATLGLRLASHGSVVEPRRETMFATPGSRVAHAATWAAIGAAAAVAVMLGTSRLRPPAGEPRPTAPPIAQATSALAWLQVREIGETTASVAGELEGVVAEEAPSDEADDSAVVPEWMVEIAGQSSGKGKP
jgi:hypothetical protein